MFFLLSWEVSPGNIQSCYNLSHQSDLLFFLSLIPTFEWYTKELSWFFCEWRNSSAKVYILAMIKCIVFKCLLHNVLCACCMIHYYKTSGCCCWKHPGVLSKNIPMFYCKTWGCSWFLPLEMQGRRIKMRCPVKVLTGIFHPILLSAFWDSCFLLWLYHSSKWWAPFL